MSKELPRHVRRSSSPASYTSGTSSSPRNPLDQCEMNFRTLLGFVSTRVLRGGPRLVIQLILAAFALLILGRFLASPTSSDTLFSSGSRWSWSPFGGSVDDTTSAVGTGKPGGVRVVAFGSPDIATPSTGKGTDGKGWTEMLCEELRCSSHHSFIPSISLPAQAMTSNEHYRHTIAKVTADNEQSKAPGYNYDFLLEQFPLSDTIADLKAQVDGFLAQPQPRDLPRETVWVFTFGTWDVWALASLPRELGQDLVDAAVAALFAQIERVYQASLDAESAAFSDFWTYQDASLIEKLNAVEDEGRGEVDPREVENFRLIVPELLDVSLTPGWHARRPAPPSPHTKAEQMTNAAHLTARWNSEVKGRMDMWMRTADPRAEDGEEKGKFGYVSSGENTNAAAGSRLLRARDERGLKPPAEGEALRVPFPRRVGAQVDGATFVREAIVERQLRDHGLTDHTGRGNRTDGGGGGEEEQQGGSIFFAETWTPCIWARTSETPDVDGAYAACDSPGDYLFHSPFTLGERAVRETARIAAAETRSRLAFVDSSSADEAEAEAQEAAAEKTKRRERRGETRGFQRVMRPNRAMRLVDAACPTLDVC
ncbi:hypothetical protein CH35J_012433 [Colletotrichum higginsianum]|uniref:Uncharacterized protein n=1 Tax=Colletotrichum higginsianum TaxID=80884 RepID=A0A4T0VD46_9PEZI|nr:hypothetical protein CH35J_012433 [Colletotrichum higginsianum]